MSKKLEAHKFINRVIGISDKMSSAMMAITVGLGGQEVIRQGIVDLEKLCAEWKEQSHREAGNG